MRFIKGMRDKMQKYLRETDGFEAVMEVRGGSVYDCCCFGVDRNGKLSDDRYMVFYNQTASPKGEIRYAQEGNKTRFRIDLKGIPDSVARLIFTVSIDGDGTMADMDFCRYSIFQNGEECISIESSKEDFLREKAIICAEIYKKDCWRFAAVCSGFNGGLSSLLSHFGGVEEGTGKAGEVPVQEAKERETVRNRGDGRKTGMVNQSEVFNKKDGSGTPTHVSFRYNPYMVESVISIDGKEVEAPSKLYDLRNERIQVWLDRLLPVLAELCNDNYFHIDFYGLRLDFDDLYETVKGYCTGHPEMEVRLDFTEARGSEDRLNELKRLFGQMQRDCPFEDLKDRQIQDNFYRAVSSEFEVSVIATMSSGKSTLINALLGRELMPSKNEACTAVIAKIKDKNDVQGFRAECRDKENQVLGSYENLTLADMEEMNANSDTAFINIEGNIPNIDSSGMKLVLVDTPGPNNSRTEEHRIHTYRVIKEKTKPMVLYVLNATQLQTNDDYNLLSEVAEAMKVGGKQSKDRFIFAVNKIDQFDPDKESVQDALQHVREYLRKFDIENPNIFPTSAETAKVIRMYQNHAKLTKGQSKTLANCSLFVEEPQLHLSEQASLGRNNLLRVRQSVEDRKKAGDLYGEVLWHTGIPAVEMAINEYLKKYAYTAKIKTAVDTFRKKVEEKNMHAEMLNSIRENESSRNEIHRQLEGIKEILEEGKEAEKFREKIEALDMMKDAKIRIREIRARISKELKPSCDKGAMTTLEVQHLMMKLNNAVLHLQSAVKAELEGIINDVIVENANAVMEEYTQHIRGLIQSGAVERQQYSRGGGETGVAFLEMDIPNAQEIINSYKYDEKYDTGEEEWVANTNKRWYKPWTWFAESGHYRTIYANREMVDYSTVENEFLTPVLTGFNENLERAQDTAQTEAEKFKQFFLERLGEMENALKEKVEENEELTQNQTNIESLIEQEKENVEWLEGFLGKLDRILEI